MTKDLDEAERILSRCQEWVDSCRRDMVKAQQALLEASVRVVDLKRKQETLKLVKEE